MTKKRVSSHNRVRAFALNLTSLIVLAGMICLLQTGEAFAHAQLVKSRPAPRASLKEPPHEVRLWFNEQLEPAFSIATVVNNEGKVISSEAAQVDDDDPKLLVLRLPVLAPGKYEVRYQVLSVDGHTVESSFRFSVR
jgi:methionine-rich copper-binding protein CopC